MITHIDNLDQMCDLMCNNMIGGAMVYKLYLLGNEAVCPKCKGCVKKMTVTPLYWKCSDCEQKYEWQEFGDAEKEIIVKEIL